MPVGSISSSAVAAYYGSPLPSAEQASGAAGEARSVADHVAAADDNEPIRSVSATQGTLVDTYL
jgi:hypothetical protein